MPRLDILRNCVDLLMNQVCSDCGRAVDPACYIECEGEVQCVNCWFEEKKHGVQEEDVQRQEQSVFYEDGF